VTSSHFSCVVPRLWGAKTITFLPTPATNLAASLRSAAMEAAFGGRRTDLAGVEHLFESRLESSANGVLGSPSVSAGFRAWLCDDGDLRYLVAAGL
jgi:hypothetical protein